MRFPDPEAAFTISFAELEGMLATADAVDTLLKQQQQQQTAQSNSNSNSNKNGNSNSNTVRPLQGNVRSYKAWYGLKRHYKALRCYVIISN